MPLSNLSIYLSPAIPREPPARPRSRPEQTLPARCGEPGSRHKLATALRESSLRESSLPAGAHATCWLCCATLLAAAGHPPAAHKHFPPCRIPRHHAPGGSTTRTHNSGMSCTAMGACPYTLDLRSEWWCVMVFPVRLAGLHFAVPFLLPGPPQAWRSHARALQPAISIHGHCDPCETPVGRGWSRPPSVTVLKSVSCNTWPPLYLTGGTILSARVSPPPMARACATPTRPRAPLATHASP